METSSTNRSAFASWLLCLLGVTLVVAMGLGHGSGWGRGVQRSGMEKRLAEQLPALEPAPPTHRPKPVSHAIPISIIPG